jgi:hypothetical protein
LIPAGLFIEKSAFHEIRSFGILIFEVLTEATIDILVSLDQISEDICPEVLEELVASSSTLEMDVQGSSETSANRYQTKGCDKKTVIPTFISCF